MTEKMNSRISSGVEYGNFWAQWTESEAGGSYLLGEGEFDTSPQNFDNIIALKGAMKEIAPLRKWKNTQI